jgi:hypothetical protein
MVQSGGIFIGKKQSVIWKDGFYNWEKEPTWVLFYDGWERIYITRSIVGNLKQRTWWTLLEMWAVKHYLEGRQWVCNGVKHTSFGGQSHDFLKESRG